VNQPLVPTTIEPGVSSFTLTVNGAGFVPTSVVKWNGNVLPTTYVGEGQVTARVPATNVASEGTAFITVFSPAPGGGTSNAVPFTATYRTNRPTFSASSFGVGLNPGNVVVADFNNDGKQDLAVVNQTQPDPACYHFGGAGTISIFLGNGDGTFSQKSSICLRDLAGAVVRPWVAVGDLNNDGNQDLFASCTGVSLMVCGETFLGNGDGTFQAGQSVPTPGFRLGPAVSGDFNRDGWLDFAVPYRAEFISNNIAILAGNGDGTLNNLGPIINCAPFRCIVSNAVVAGDFNGDGILDLASVFDGPFENFGEEPLAVFLGNGRATFTESAAIPSLVLVTPVSLTTGDFDHDGKLDLAISESGSNDLIILHGNGDGTFVPVNGQPIVAGSSNVAMADLNSDGNLDLVFSGGANSIEICLGNGDGTFQACQIENVGNAPQASVISDFNGDGRLDIATVNSADNTITILLQTPPSPYKAAVQQPINLDGSSVFKAVRGVVPVKFSLTENDLPTCALPPADIVMTRTAGGVPGPVDANIFTTNANNGSAFRIDATTCKYVYNLDASSLGVGTYRAEIRINGIIVGHAVFALK
jgi:hypothetical protein